MRMALYTIISEFDIFTNGEKPTEFLDIPSGKVEYIRCGKNKVVKSLFSTDPKLYLDVRYSPGKRLM